MGIIIGTFTLILGLLFLVFPKFTMNFFRLKGKGIHQEKGKTKFEIAKRPLYELVDESKAIMWTRIVGIVFLIVSVFAYISQNAP